MLDLIAEDVLSFIIDKKSIRIGTSHCIEVLTFFFPLSCKLSYSIVFETRLAMFCCSPELAIPTILICLASFNTLTSKLNGRISTYMVEDCSIVVEPFIKSIPSARCQSCIRPRCFSSVLDPYYARGSTVNRRGCGVEKAGILSLGCCIGLRNLG